MIQASYTITVTYALFVDASSGVPVALQGAMHDALEAIGTAASATSSDVAVSSPTVETEADPGPVRG